jgi:hypothetical protein
LFSLSTAEDVALDMNNDGADFIDDVFLRRTKNRTSRRAMTMQVMIIESADVITWHRRRTKSLAGWDIINHPKLVYTIQLRINKELITFYILS